MNVVYNKTRATGDRVVSIDVLVVDEKNVPRYEPLNPERYYRCITSSFLANGGDEFDMISKYKKNHKYAFDRIVIKMLTLALQYFYSLFKLFLYLQKRLDRS